MKRSINNPAPEGYSTVCPYLMVNSVEAQIEFLKSVFYAKITEELNRKDGEVRHGQVQIGDTTVMMGKSTKEYTAMESMNYVFVENVDETFQRALKHGATAIMEPTDQFYGNRDAGLRDPQGNQWWIASQIEKLSSEEMQKRMDESE